MRGIERQIHKNLGDISPFSVSIKAVTVIKEPNYYYSENLKKEFPRTRVAYRLSEHDNLDHIISRGFTYKNSNIDYCDPQWSIFPSGIRVYHSLRNLLFLNNKKRDYPFIVCDLYLNRETSMFYSRCRTPPPFNHVFITKNPDLLIPRFLVYYSIESNKKIIANITRDEWNKIGYNDYDCNLSMEDNLKLSETQFIINNTPQGIQGISSLVTEKQ